MSEAPNYSEKDFGMQTHPNPGRKLIADIKGISYNRYPVRTHLVQLGENYLDVITKYVKPYVQPGDIVTMSEKFIGICQKRVVHISEAKDSWLARLIVKFVTKYPDDVGWENPKKMQVAINEVGVPRAILAVIVGGFMKYVFRKPGYFYVIMGREATAIDGFNPHTIPPFNEYATLAPSDPSGVCNEVEKLLGVPTVVVDASNVAVHVLGSSDGLKDTGLSWNDIEMLIADNPTGQNMEQTPILIIRKAG